jgi:5-methyltetrahydrofolate--homocysteine methyltransferase
LETTLEGRETRVVVGPDGPLILIGERINPTGRKKLAESLARGDMSMVKQEALRQAQAGAQAIDVNASAAEIDEVEILPQAVKAVAEVVGLPIVIDTSNHEALAAALEVCPGKPLVNSVTGEDSSLAALLPLVKDHRCAVIGLCIDEQGIPKDADRRLGIARKIVKVTEERGIPREDLIIDPLAMTVGADHRAGLVTLEAIAAIARELKLNVVYGGSNVSFGLPDRSLLNRAYLAMAMAAGLTCVIADPLDAEIRRTIGACDLLLGRDEFAMRFIQHCRAGW